MRDIRLADLNFRELIDYGGQPPVQNHYAPPLECRGYCVSCEESQTSGDLMSHGCDSADFEAVLGPMPRTGGGVGEPVLFLLENPGADYGNGNPVDFRGFRKQPPVKHYYWTPSIQSWPTRVAEFAGDFSGPYFAYLMHRHQLHEVYITNLVKCRWIRGDRARSGDSDIRRHCIERYLTREVEFFAPQLALCFGRIAERVMQTLLQRAGRKCRVVYLLHPAFLQYRHRTVGRSQEELVQENDTRVTQALAQRA